MPKTDEQLALEEKVDLARTLIRYKGRRQSARELNEIEDAIRKSHEAEVAAGSVSQVDLDSIGASFLVKELPSGDNTDNGTDTDTD